MPKKSSLIDVLVLFNNKHKNKYDYSKTVYVNNTTNVEIICPTHGSFFQLPLNHKKGAGCPKCAITKKAVNKTLPKSYFISFAREKHNNNYDYSKVYYKNLKTKVEIICPTHGSFWQLPQAHLRGQGCKLCADIIRNNNSILL